MDDGVRGGQGTCVRLGLCVMHIGEWVSKKTPLVGLKIEGEHMAREPPWMMEFEVAKARVSGSCCA